MKVLWMNHPGSYKISEISHYLLSLPFHAVLSFLHCPGRRKLALCPDFLCSICIFLNIFCLILVFFMKCCGTHVTFVYRNSILFQNCYNCIEGNWTTGTHWLDRLSNCADESGGVDKRYKRLSQNLRGDKRLELQCLFINCQPFVTASMHK